MTADQDARAANRVSYGSGAEVRGYVTDPYHRMRRRIAARMLADAMAAPDGRPGTGAVLELGPGPESMLGALPPGARPVVADLAFDALRAGARDGGGVPAVCLDATRPLPFRDQQFAAVVMGELIEHVYDPRGLLRECHRVLRPAGVLVLTTPNLANLQDRLRFLGGRAPRQVNPLHPYLWLHIRPFTASLLEHALCDASFQLTGLRSNYVVWQLSEDRWLKWRALARIAPSLGGSLIISARRKL